MYNFSDYIESALTILRKPQATMKWYAVPLFVMVLYFANKEIHEGNYKIVLGGFALWGLISSMRYGTPWSASQAAGLLFGERRSESVILKEKLKHKKAVIDSVKT